MAILKSFFPWFVFWIFMSLRKLEIATIGAASLGLLVILIDVYAKRTVKILELGTFLFFVLATILFFTVGPKEIGRWLSPMGSAAFTLIVLFSIAIRKPFTLQYARESVDEEHWERPSFIRRNYVISWVWFSALLLNTFFSILFAVVIDVELWVNWAISLSCFGLAILFTQIYRRSG